LGTPRCGLTWFDDILKREVVDVARLHHHDPVEQCGGGVVMGQTRKKKRVSFFLLLFSESASDASGGSVRRPLRIGSYIALWLIRKGSEFS
jgi:hypothetical protein